jgi:hypothetical protein
MTETNGASGGRRLAVYAVPETKEGARSHWPKIGVAFTNRDGSIAILLDALPLGTNRLQVREQRDDARPAGASRGKGLETVEVRP